MATSIVSRLAPVTARDGVDTRKKDNCGTAAAVKQETTSLVGLGQGGQSAASYLAPPGAEKEGSAMNAYWSNYLSVADSYVKGESDSFMWVGFDTQQSHNEIEIQRACDRMGPNTHGFLNVYRQFHNAAITEFRKTLQSTDLVDALENLEEFNNELRTQVAAANVIKSWFRASKTSDTGTYIADDECEYCPCGFGAHVLAEGMCADCYWEDDARIKKSRRARRQNAIPSGGVY